MATTISGILGGMRGKIGPVVGCQLGDTFYIRSRPRKRTVEPGEKESANRAAFALVQSWLQPLKPVLQTGFKNYGSKTGGFRAAFAYHRKHAVAGTYPNFYMNLDKVMLSGGLLPGAVNPVVHAQTSGELHFNWTYNTLQDANPYDQVMLVAYQLSSGEAVYTTTGNFRKAGEDRLAIPANWSGKTVAVWLAFIAADRSMQADSQFLGEVVCG